VRQDTGSGTRNRVHKSTPLEAKQEDCALPSRQKKLNSLVLVRSQPGNLPRSTHGKFPNT